MNKTLAVVLAAFVLACFTPASGMAKSDSGQGGGSQSGDQDRTRDPDKLRDGSCLMSIDGNILMAKANRAGKRSGLRDGSGPRRDRDRDGSCLKA